MNACAFKGAHELLEASAFFAPEQRVGWKLEVLEAELVLLHATVAEHLDLRAREPFVHELGLAVLARQARLLREEHREALVARLVGIGPGE